MNAIDVGPRSLRRFAVDDAFDDIMAAVDADGSAIVERFIAPELVARLNAQLDAPIARRAPGSDDVGAMMGWFWGQQTKRFTRLAAIAPAFAEVVDHDFMHRWARRELANDYWLNTG